MSQAGRLLVATPLIGDPNFERTVVLLLAHGGEGAFGVVINRPSETSVHEVADEWAPHVAAPGVVFVGGPVGTDSVVGIARCVADPGPSFGRLVGDLGTVDLHRPPGGDDHPWSGVRLFAGSAGWAPGQLEDELEEGAWWVVDPTPDDLTTADPSALWAAVLRRQPGQVAWFANHPLDTSAN
ncbi:YqgE/AlgH family protein [Aquihabitans sp. G128]|nr:YqgE/AlgH family protein [Aquihabitans sp. G128]QXC60362.1 YqgE/AlgH family protein [Aquihabitans sp. G128]